MPKIGEIIAAGGVLPALATGAMGDENKGFALGMLPGMAYRDRKKRKESEAGQIPQPGGMKKGGKVKVAKPKMGSASSRADGIAQRGKTRGKMV